MMAIRSILIRKSFADIALRPGHSVLVVLAIVIGVGGLTAVDVAERALSSDYNFSLAGNGPHPDATIVLDRLDPVLLNGISHLPGVTSVQSSSTVDTQWHVGRAPGHVDFTIVAYPDPTRLSPTPFQLLRGRYPGRGEIVMDYGDSASQPVSAGDMVTVDTAAGTAALRVVGIARTPGENPAVSGKTVGYMSDAGLAALPMHTYVAGQQPMSPFLTRDVALGLRTPASYQVTVNAVAGLARDRAATVLTVSPPQQAVSPGAVRGLFGLVWVLIAVALLLATMLLVNTIAALIADQVGVLGTMKALGATRIVVIRGYLTTVLLYCAMATPFGIVVGIAVGTRMSSILAATIPLAPGPVRLSVPTLVLGITAGVGIPALAALVPLWLGTGVGVREALSGWGIASVESAPDGVLTRLLAGRFARMPQTVWLGTRGLFRRPWRAALSVATVAIAAVCFLIAQTMATSIGTSIESVWGNLSADVEVYVGGQHSVTDMRSLLAPIPDIGTVERVGWYGAPTPWGKVSAWGIEPDSRLYHPRVTGGRWFTAADRHVVLLSDDLATRSGVAIGGSFPVAGPGGGTAVSMTVIGTIKESVDDPTQVGAIVMPVDEVYEQLGASSGTVAGFTDRILIQAKDRSPVAVDRLARAVDAAGRRATSATGDDLVSEVFLFDDEIVRHQRDFVPLYDLLFAMCVIVGAVGILGLTDALSASVLRHRREIGLMRALGASGRRVGTVFLVEALALSVLAWLVGAAIGFPLSYLFVGLFRRNVMPVEFHLDPLSFLLMFVATVVIAALSALVPALRAASLRAVDLLRHE